MSRFSEFQTFYKKFFKEYLQTHNMLEIFQLIADQVDNSKTSLSKQLFEHLFAEWCMIFNRFDEMFEILDRLKDAEDPVVSAYAHSQLVFYYTGWFHPPVDVNLAKHHYNQAKQIIDSYEFKDDWEKSFLLSIFLHSQSIFEGDVEKRIQMIENLRENNRKLPEYGDEFSYYQEVAFAQFFHQNGKFDEAIQSYEKVIELTGKDLIVFAYTGMANVRIKQAEIDKAYNHSEKTFRRLNREITHF